MSEEETNKCKDCDSAMKEWKLGTHPVTKEETARVRCVQCRRWEWV